MRVRVRETVRERKCVCERKTECVCTCVCMPVCCFGYPLTIPSYIMALRFLNRSAMTLCCGRETGESREEIGRMKNTSVCSFFFPLFSLLSFFQRCYLAKARVSVLPHCACRCTALTNNIYKTIFLCIFLFWDSFLSIFLFVFVT